MVLLGKPEVTANMYCKKYHVQHRLAGSFGTPSISDVMLDTIFQKKIKGVFQTDASLQDEMLRDRYHVIENFN